LPTFTNLWKLLCNANFLSTDTQKTVAYYRHSAEDKQENSAAIQQQHTEKFANKHNIEIIHEEADEGETGLLDTRPAFQRLFTDWVENKDAPHFDYVFAYDVSRWGRFQNQNKDFSHWCFRISEDTRRFDSVLAISVVPDTKEMLDNFFLFSINDFTRTNFLILSQNNSVYRSSKIESSSVEEAITRLISNY